MSRFLRGWRFTVSSAINMFYKQIILQQGIPFDVKLPKAPENSAKWSKERRDGPFRCQEKIQGIVRMQKSLDKARNGRVLRQHIRVTF